TAFPGGARLPQAAQGTPSESALRHRRSVIVRRRGGPGQAPAQHVSAFAAVPLRLVSVSPMPELPEVEVLVRTLAPRLENQTIRRVEVRRARVLRPTPPAQLKRALTGARFVGLARRAKYLTFTLQRAGSRETFLLLGHLGMSGRMYLQPANAPLPKHTA